MNPNSGNQGIGHKDTTSDSAKKIQDVQRGAQLEKSARAEAGRDKLHGRAPLNNNGASGLNSNNNNNSNNSGGASSRTPGQSPQSSSGAHTNNAARDLGRSLAQGQHQFKKQMAREGIKAAGQSVGVPTALTERALNTKPGDRVLERVASGGISPAKAAKAAKDLATGGSGKDEADKSVAEKSDEKEKASILSGEISAGFSMKTIQKIVIITPAISLVLIFFVLIIGSIVNEKNAMIVLGKMVAEEKAKEIKDKIHNALNIDTDDEKNCNTLLNQPNVNPSVYSDCSDYIASISDKEKRCELMLRNPQAESSVYTECSDYVNNQTGNGELAYSVGKGDKYPDEYYKRLDRLGGVFTNQEACKGEDCLDNTEFLYYLKVADLSLRYQNKYHVTLDWALLVTANTYFESDLQGMMEANLSDYDKDNVEDYSTLSTLDWDIDYKNLPGYKYLDKNDSRYDLNILAKNMVKKTTTQTCTNSNGTIVSSQTDEDVEDSYFTDGGSKRLKCGSGEKYNISSVYIKDLNKFDEFLLEYIDRKIYGYDNNNSVSVDGNNMSETFVKLAVSQIGDPEGVNGKRYWSWMGYGNRIEWCAAFVSWALAHTEYEGTKLNSLVNHKSPSVFTFANYFYNTEGLKFYYNDNNPKYKGKNGDGTYTPKEGDLIFFDWDYDWNGTMPTVFGPLDHIGIVQRVEGDKIITIEGNTSNMVAERTYNLNSKNVVAFGSWY